MATHSTRPDATREGRKKLSNTRNDMVPSATKDTDPLAALKKQFKTQLSTLRMLFSESWSDGDLIAVLEEVNGDVDTAISRISEGHAQQWSSSTTKKPKKPQPSLTATESVPAKTGVRDVRPRIESTRGRSDVRGRGRGRGRGRSIANGPSRRVEDSMKPVAENTVMTEPTWGAEPVADVGKDWGAESTTASSSWGEKPAPDAVSRTAWSTTAEKAPSDHQWSSTASTTSKSSQWHADTSPNGTAAAGGSWSHQASTVASSTPAAVAATASKTVVKKGTWAQIAKPELPAPKPVEVVESKPAPAARQPSPKRSVSPKRPAVTAAASTDSGVKLVAVNGREEPKAAPAPVAKKVDAPVVMPNVTSNVSAVGVKFGSLSVDEVEEKKPVSRVAQPVTAAAPAPVTQTGGATYIKDQSFAAAPEPVSEQLPSYGQDYNSLYANLNGASTSQANSSTTSSNPQAAPVQYPLNAASLANMYAAYFPYYMNQFAGAPYGSSGAPAGFGQPAAFMNKGYPMYPMQGQQQQQQQQQPSSTAGGSGLPNKNAGYSGYYTGASSTQDDAQDYGKYPSFLNQQQTGVPSAASSSSSGKPDASKMTPQQSQAAAYYSQFMHPAQSYPGYMPPGFMQQQQGQPGSRQQGQQGQQQPYWTGGNS